MSDRKAQLEHNLSDTRAEIERLAAQSGRKPPQLLPVTKFHPAADISLLADLGVTDVAENREQEARAKAEVIAGALGMRLGGALSVSTSGGYQPPPMMPKTSPKGVVSVGG